MTKKALGEPELQRFVAKAEAYRLALKSSPAARNFELVPILAALESIRKKLALSRAELRVIDLMSGDGFLSRALFKFGYKNLHAIESCNEMSFGSPAYNEVPLISPPNVQEALRAIGPLNPHVVVSLASFHHLIEYNVSGEVNLKKSAEIQKNVIEGVINNAPNLAAFVCCDLFQDEIESQNEDSIEVTRGAFSFALNYQSGPLLGLMQPRRSETLADWSKRVSEKSLGNAESNPALHWFRNAVDGHTSIGHKDAALSVELVSFLRQIPNCDICLGRFSCPWVFTSKDELVSFVHRKFGYSLDFELKSNRAELDRLLDRHAHITERDGRVYFDWALSALVVERNNLRRDRSALLTLWSILFFGFALASAFAFLFGSAVFSIDIDFIVKTGLGVAIGGLIATLIDVGNGN